MSKKSRGLHRALLLARVRSNSCSDFLSRPSIGILLSDLEPATLTLRPSLLPGWLIEPCLHIKLPLLLEVLICDNIVVPHHRDAPWPCKKCKLDSDLAANPFLPTEMPDVTIPYLSRPDLRRLKRKGRIYGNLCSMMAAGVTLLV